MLKKLLIILLLIIPNILLITNIYSANIKAPGVNCIGLPGCESSTITKTDNGNVNKNITLERIGGIIGELIQYVSVIAVISVMISGVLYMTSGGEEEKVKKAKSWIIWSLVGVFLSISAWGIINMLNMINLD